MTKTIQLDPDALQAATKVYFDLTTIYQWEDFIASDPMRVFSAEETQSIITAYLAAIEPQVRDAVESMKWHAINFAMTTPETDEEQLADDSLIDAEAALFALLGMTETTPETTGN